MGLRDRVRRTARSGAVKAAVRGVDDLDTEHLSAFATSRRGVEGFVEPETLQTPTTLALVAADGEWTRRRMPSRKAAFALGSTLGIPVYDVAATGYPSRMREWTAARKAAGEQRS